MSSNNQYTYKLLAFTNRLLIVKIFDKIAFIRDKRTCP